METFARVRDAKVSPGIKVAWQDVVDHWDDPKRHDAIFAMAATQDSLGWLGGRYRAHGKDEPIAAARIEKIFKATEATLLATSSDRDPARGKRNSLIAFGIALMVLAIIGAAVYFTAPGSKSVPPAQPVQTR